MSCSVTFLLWVNLFVFTETVRSCENVTVSLWKDKIYLLIDPDWKYQTQNINNWNVQVHSWLWHISCDTYELFLELSTILHCLLQWKEHPVHIQPPLILWLKLGSTSTRWRRPENTVELPKTQVSKPWVQNIFYFTQIVSDSIQLCKLFSTSSTRQMSKCSRRTKTNSRRRNWSKKPSFFRRMTWRWAGRAALN